MGPMAGRSIALAAALLALPAACGSEGDTDGPDAGGGGEAPSGEPTLATVHTPDPALADQGHAAFSDGELIQGLIPPEAMRHLYLTWSDQLPSYAFYSMNEEQYWEDFNARYGTIPSPFEGATYPAGFGVADDGRVGIDCLLCHAGRLEGQTVIGLSNNRLDLRGFVDDLKALPDAIAALKASPPPPPYDVIVAAIPDTQVPEPYASLEVPTGAAGSNDGFGLGLLTATFYEDPPPGLNTFAGYQDAPAWWTIRFKERLYTDGSAPADGVYTMMSTLLAFGLSYAELASYLPTFQAIRNYLCSLEVPRWSDHDLPPIDEALAAEGAQVFAERCAQCHGGYTGDAFPNAVVTPAEIGTDPFRVEQFGPTEADWFNSFIPQPDYEMTATEGYLAPVLAGIWASAPYLHNGSVPTLRALLDPSLRPTRWRRSGGSLDPVDVGLSYEVVDQPADRNTIEGRKVVDTAIEAMGNQGHAIDIPSGSVDALLEFLKTL